MLPYNLFHRGSYHPQCSNCQLFSHHRMSTQLVLPERGILLQKLSLSGSDGEGGAGVERGPKNKFSCFHNITLTFKILYIYVLVLKGNGRSFVVLLLGQKLGWLHSFLEERRAIYFIIAKAKPFLSGKE